MQILQLNKRYWPHRGGVERHVRDLSVGLAAEPDTAVSALVCNEGRDHLLDVDDGVAVERVPGYGAVWSLPFAPSYPRAVWRRLTASPDVVHLHEPFPLGVASLLIARERLHTLRRRGSRLVVTWHSDVVRQRVVLPVYGFLLRALLAEADAIVVPTERHVESSRFLPAVAHKCHVIPFGIDTAPFASPLAADRGAALRARFGSERVVLYVGRLVPYKGLPHLIRAMRRVRGVLVMAGDGRDRHALERLAREAGVAERVHFAGDIPEADLPAYYHACNVFVLPSVQVSEGFGIVQLEAMASGRPVVSTALPTGASTVSVHRQTGIVVPPADEDALATALGELLDDPALARALGEAGKQRVTQRYGLARMVAETLSLYHQASI